MPTEYIKPAAKVVVVLMIASVITYQIVKFYEKDVPSNSDRIEAQKTFNNLKSLKSQQFNDQILTTYNQTKNEILTKIQNQNRTLSIDITTKLNETKTKILSQQNNAANVGINVDRCVAKTLKELAEFRRQLLETSARCFGDPHEDSEMILDEILTDARNNLDLIVDCAGKSLFECDISRDFECYGYVVKKIESAAEKLPKIVGKFQVALVNLGEGFSKPCENLIVTNLALYPDVLLDYVTSCAKSKTLEMESDVC